MAAGLYVAGRQASRWWQREQALALYENGHRVAHHTRLRLLLQREIHDHGRLDDLDAIGTTLLPAYLEGLADEGVDIDPQVVEAGWAISLAVRSVFSALVVDHRPDLDPTARDRLLARRALTCRFGLDLALTTANLKNQAEFGALAAFILGFAWLVDVTGELLMWLAFLWGAWLLREMYRARG